MGAMAEVKKPNNTIDKLALIVTTYKRQQLLETLFDSILALEQAPWRIVIVDNEQSDQTADMVAAFAGKVTANGAPPWPTSPVTKNVWSMRRRPRTWVVRAVSPPAWPKPTSWVPHGSG